MRNQTTNHLGERLNETLAKLDPQVRERIRAQTTKLGNKVFKAMRKAAQDDDMPIEMIAVAVMEEVATMFLGHAQADIASQSMCLPQALTRFDKMREDMVEAADVAMQSAIISAIDSLLSGEGDVEEAETQQAA